MVTHTGSLVLGEWKGPVHLPPKKDFESLKSDFIGVDKENFVSFMECFIAWLPNDRLTCLQAIFILGSKPKRTRLRHKHYSMLPLTLPKHLPGFKRTSHEAIVDTWSNDGKIITLHRRR